jgi:hypothetical protein
MVAPTIVRTGFLDGVLVRTVNRDTGVRRWLSGGRIVRFQESLLAVLSEVPARRNLRGITPCVNHKIDGAL